MGRKYEQFARKLIIRQLTEAAPAIATPNSATDKYESLSLNFVIKSQLFAELRFSPIENSEGVLEHGLVLRFRFLLELHDHHDQKLVEVDLAGAVLVDHFDDLVELILGRREAEHLEDLEQLSGRDLSSAVGIEDVEGRLEVYQIVNFSDTVINSPSTCCGVSAPRASSAVIILIDPRRSP